MKFKNKFLIASLFTGLSLGVLSGVNFATNATEVNAAEAKYFVPLDTFELNNLHNVHMVFGVVDFNTFYYSSSVSTNVKDGMTGSSFTINTNSSIAVDGKTAYYSGSSSASLKTATYYLFTEDTGTAAQRRIKCINKSNGKSSITPGNSYKHSGDAGYSANLYANNNADNWSKYYISSGKVYNVGNGWPIALDCTSGSTDASKRWYCTTDPANSTTSYKRVQMYAEVERKSITLYKDSSNTCGSVYGYYGMKLPTVDKPTKTGHTFAGYYTAASGGTQVINDKGVGVSVYQNDYTKLYAHWTANTCSVGYNKGTYGTGTNTSATYTYGNNLTTKGAIFTRTGYTQTGWSVTAAGTTNDYKLSTAYNFGTGITLYPYWSPNEYKVTFDMAGGSNGTESIDAAYDASMPAITLPVKSGYVFGGYYTGENGTGTQYYDLNGTSMQTYKFTQGLALYAKWTPATYHVSLSSQGGTGGSTTVDTVFNQAVPSVTAPTRTGHTFKGYFSELNGKGIKYINEDGSSTGNAWTTASDSTIYAHWTANQYTVTFNKGIGTGGSGSVTATFDASMPTITLPTKAGYTFEGYFDASAGGEKYYDVEGNSAKSWDKANDTTLYAQWTRDEYSITYENLQGSTHTNPISFNVESETITLSDPTVRPGHTFVGWFDALDGGNKVTSISKGSTGNVKVYAHWSDDTSYQPTCSNSLGGWITDTDGKQKQIVAFGFQFSGEIYPTNDNDFGIIAYRSLASGVEYAKGTVADLIANEGRFYMYLIIDEAEPVTCYAKAFVKFNGEYIYSSLVSATGDLTGTEYVL